MFPALFSLLLFAASPFPTAAAVNGPPQAGIATFAGGCFWCLEAVFERFEGVHSVTSGYTGGSMEHPSYEQVCSGRTGHAEAVRIEYDPAVVSYERLLEIFWKCHDPTTLNRQGPDVGTQYRSAVFVHGAEQRAQAEASRKKAQGGLARPIVTEVVDAPAFYPAEAYHQDYFRNNPNAAYCRLVIQPKLEKVKP